VLARRLIERSHDRQFDGYALLRFDIRRAFNFEAMLRVVNVDAMARAVSMQNRSDTRGMPGRTSCAGPGPRAHGMLTAQDVAACSHCHPRGC
jgi:hypothetical protein